MLKIASWNLRNFSKKRNMKEIAEVMQNFDIIAIQEVRNDEAVVMLCNILKYEYIISKPEGSSSTTAKQTGKRKEMYAFIYKSDIQLCKYSSVHADEYFVRAPFMGFFKYKEFDFILSTIHVVWGTKKDREFEIKYINLLLEKIKEKAGGENDIILCGDFNTPPDEFNLPDEWKPLIHENTMCNKNKISIYDNIWVTDNTKKFNINSGVYIGAGSLSDHYPVFAEFTCDQDDDIGIPDLNIKL